MAGGVAFRAVLAVAGDRAVDDPRVLLAHPLVADAEPVEHAGPEGLEHDVVFAHEPQQRLAPALVLQVEADRALVAVEREEQRRLARSRARPRSRAATSGCSRPCPCPRPSARRRRSRRAAASRSRRASRRERSSTRIPCSGRLMRGSRRAAGTLSIARASSTVAGRRPSVFGHLPRLRDQLAVRARHLAARAGTGCPPARRGSSRRA